MSGSFCRVWMQETVKPWAIHEESFYAVQRMFLETENWNTYPWISSLSKLNATLLSLSVFSLIWCIIYVHVFTQTGTFSFVFHTYTDTTCKPVKWTVFCAAKEKKMGCKILAFSGFEWVLQDCAGAVWICGQLGRFHEFCDCANETGVCLFIC